MEFVRCTAAFAVYKGQLLLLQKRSVYMKHMKKLIVLVLAVALILSLSGCLVQVNEEKNRNIVVATITDENGNVTEIKKGDFLDLYQYYYMQYYYTYYYYYNIDLGSNDADAVEARNAIKDNVLDSLVNTQVYTLEMELAGYEVNDDDRKKAQEEYDTAIDDLAKSYMEEDDVEGYGWRVPQKSRGLFCGTDCCRWHDAGRIHGRDGQGICIGEIF